MTNQEYIDALSYVVRLPDRPSCSLLEFAQRIAAAIRKEQDKIESDRELVSLLSDAARFGWEYLNSACFPDPHIAHCLMKDVNTISWAWEGIGMSRPEYLSWKRVKNYMESNLHSAIGVSETTPEDSAPESSEETTDNENTARINTIEQSLRSMNGMISKLSEAVSREISELTYSQEKNKEDTRLKITQIEQRLGDYWRITRHCERSIYQLNLKSPLSDDKRIGILENAVDAINKEFQSVRNCIQGVEEYLERKIEQINAGTENPPKKTAPKLQDVLDFTQKWVDPQGKNSIIPWLSSLVGDIWAKFIDDGTEE